MENGAFGKVCRLLAVLILVYLDFSHGACYRKPQGATGDHSPVDENYQIQIDGNPSSYLPGQQYNISLSSANGFKFISFTLLVEAESADILVTSSGAGVEHVLGHFEIIDNAETKFSNLCENMIESSNTNGKNRVNVAWVAPTDPQGGCVLFKAAILQHRDVWFIDDGFLTKRLCPEEIDEINSQTPPVNPCCSCDEAKYEIILERKWRRNTHAKDFPSELWRTKLGEIIGASHSLDYRFWEYGGRASQGLQELGEHGATKTLENEIKQHTQTGSIRTIIKAPSIKYRPNVIGKSLATVRVSPNHHVISLVLKIDPSPDWILGVSGLELCLANCTWIEKKVLNLYPWDIGTDAGPSYMSPDQAQHPPDVIRRISSTFPSDYRSPFFDKTGAPMKPLATLHVQKKRTYGRGCDFEETGALECATHPWSTWTECSAKCGAGTQYRTRSYKDPKVAENFNCNAVLRQNQNCIGNQCGIQQPELPAAECELTNWSTWSECSKKCGKGFQTRTRYYNNPYAKEKCQAGVAVDLQQSRACSGEKCGGNIYTSAYDTNNNNNNNNNDIYGQNYEEEELEQNAFKNSNMDSKVFSKGQQSTNWRATDVEEEQPTYDGPNNNYDNTDFRTQDPNRFIINENDNGFRGIETEEADQQKENYCLEKPVASSRRCNQTRLIVKNYWFYDADDGECKLFTADNCDENKNKFLSMEKCLETCSPSIMQENQDMVSINRGRYNSRGFEVTQQPFHSRWN